MEDGCIDQDALQRDVIAYLTHPDNLLTTYNYRIKGDGPEMLSILFGSWDTLQKLCFFYIQ